MKKTSRRTSNQKFDAFISFTENDRKIADELRWLLQKEFGLSVFFSHQNLPRGSEDWQREIMQGLSRSGCFVPILSRHSIDRPWVMFESGAAEMNRLPCCRARTADISDAQINSLPGGVKFIYRLFEEQGIAHLVFKTLSNARGESFQQNEVLERVQKSAFAARIVKLAQSRSVFIAGSPAAKKGRVGSVRLASSTGDSNDEVMAVVTKDITRALLNSAFRICACPDVSAVGLNVADEVSRWCSEKHCPWHEVFTISGQLQFPTSLNPHYPLREMIHAGFRKSRELYLKDQEWLLVLGGNERTQIEYEVARSLGSVKVVALPIFGGTGLTAYRELIGQCIQPVTPRDLVWDQELLNRVVNHFLAH